MTESNAPTKTPKEQLLENLKHASDKMSYFEETHKIDGTKGSWIYRRQTGDAAQEIVETKKELENLGVPMTEILQVLREPQEER